jgi:cytochrome c
VGVVLASVFAAVTIIASWSARQQAERIARAMTGGDPAAAPEVMRRYGCGGCHAIPGIPGADGQVGPKLSGLIHRVYIGGATNSPDHLIQWIVTPQQFSPRSAMPATGISEAEARNVAAYLYSH